MKGSIRSRIASCTACLTLIALPACDVLDVENPNNLVQDDLGSPTAAASLANGSLATTTRALGYLTALSATASDEVTWIGSRDGWGQLNDGKFGDPRNEFTDAAFPFIGEARWMADEALSLIDGFVADDPGNATLTEQQARANLHAAMIYVFIAEAYDDFVFSNRQEPGVPLGDAGMVGLFDQAIARLITAQDLTANPVLEARAQAVLVRARYSKAVWQSLKPTLNTGTLVADADVAAEAEDLLAMVEDSWAYTLAYVTNPTTDDQNNFANWLNNRSELQFGSRYIETDPAEPSANLGTKLRDPISGEADPVLAAAITAFEAGGDWSGMTVGSAREALLVLAEVSLAAGDDAAFSDHINRLRALDGLPEYSGQVDATDLLIHSRQVNLYLQNRRLADLYRFGLESDEWDPGTSATDAPGTFFPIAQTEIEANPNVSG